MQVEASDWMEPGVIAWIHAEGEDAGMVDVGDAGGEFDQGAADETQGAEGETTGGEGETAEGERVDGRRGSKELRDALKAWEQTPEGAKHAKQLRADHFRAQEIATIEPGGVTAMREKYALLESVGGVEAITTMQESVAEREATDALLASGDPKALDSLGPDFDPGLAKLTPTILDRVMKSDPEAYAAAILPHLMNGLMNSPMVGDLNRMIDALQAPHLDEKGKLAAVTSLLGKIGQWFQANEEKAGKLKTAPVDKAQEQFQQERSKFEQEQQDAHWNNKITPGIVQAENGKFDELLKPYATKLNLTTPQRQAALRDFKEKLKAACSADKDFIRQRDIYRKQKNPDPSKVSNFFKVQLTKKAQAAFDAVKEERGWSAPVAKKPAAAAVAGARTAPQTPGSAPTIVSAKPPQDQINYKLLTDADQYAKGGPIYTLYNGKRVQWKKPAQV